MTIEFVNIDHGEWWWWMPQVDAAILATMAHDLSHTIQNVGNGLRLLTKDPSGVDSLLVVRHVLTSEVVRVGRIVEELRHMAAQS
jgi:hypothetical protein